MSLMNDADDIVKEFLVESYENLDRLDRDLVMLEKSPNPLGGAMLRSERAGGGPYWHGKPWFQPILGLKKWILFVLRWT